MSRTSPRAAAERIYGSPDAPGTTGYRVLVDRVWPRSITKQAAALDEWAKDVAPSAELRKWYGHDPTRLSVFRERYLSELADSDHQTALARLAAAAHGRPLLLLTATKDLALSHAAILTDHLNQASSTSTSL